MIEITSPSRLHLTLIDMNAEIGRVDGGVGITLDHPCIRIRAERSDKVEVIGESHLRDRMVAAVGSVLDEGGVRIFIEEDMPSHVGLGSGTQAALLAAAAANELYDLGLSVRDLAIKVGRGGTSGIGVESFKSGGFILDGGHRFSEKGSFSPSSASRVDPAPIIFRHDFPDWHIILALPDTSKGAHDANEVDAFKQGCPIPLGDVQELSHVILMQMLPSILEADIESFGKAVDHIQTVGFKKIEVGLQSQEVRDVMELMRNSGSHGVGMSSFGPAVYGFVDSRARAEEICRDVQRMLDETIGGQVMVTSANNNGANIREV